MDHESEGNTNCNWRIKYSHQRTGTGTRGLRNKRTSGDHPNYSIVEIGKNTEKSPGDKRGLAVTQALGENHQLTLVRKTLNNNEVSFNNVTLASLFNNC